MALYHYNSFFIMPFICFQLHLEVCDYRLVYCSQCGREVLYVNYQIHLTSECPMRPAVCEHCGDSVPIDQLEVRSWFLYIVLCILLYHHLLICVYLF